MRRIAMHVVLAASLLSIAAAEEASKRVVVTGRAVGTTPAAEEEARLDALRVAVSQVCGSFINAQSETENYALVRDKVLEQPVGFARVVRVIKGPEKLEGFTQIQLEAEVFPVKFEKRWAEFAHIQQREGYPRCVVIVLEDDDRTDQVPPRPNGLVQTEIENFFLGKDVKLVDKTITDDVRTRDLTLAAQSGDAKKAAAAGAAFKAEVIVVGEASVEPGESIQLAGQILRRWNGSLVIRVIQTDSAAVLVSKTYRPKKTFTAAAGNAKSALTYLGRECAADVLSDMAEAWRKRATVGKTIQITLEPCTREQFKAIQAAMIETKGVTGGEDGFRLRELANRIASVEVNWKYDLNQLADRLEELTVRVGGEDIGFEIIEQSANRLTVRLRPGAKGERPVRRAAPRVPAEPAAGSPADSAPAASQPAGSGETGPTSTQPGGSIQP